MSIISLKGLNKADVLAALYNAAKPLHAGFIHYDKNPMSREEAQAMLDEGYTYFDYLKGRVMKVDVGGDTLDPYCYDRDNGGGAAQEAINNLRKTSDVNSVETQAKHYAATQASAEETLQHIDSESKLVGDTLDVGLSDLAEHIIRKVDEVLGEK